MSPWKEDRKWVRLEGERREDQNKKEKEEEENEAHFL
jgi:hypothetical protein